MFKFNHGKFRTRCQIRQIRNSQSSDIQDTFLPLVM